jgi:hypothetical protein
MSYKRMRDLALPSYGGYRTWLSTLASRTNVSYPNPWLYDTAFKGR